MTFIALCDFFYNFAMQSKYIIEMVKKERKQNAISFTTTMCLICCYFMKISAIITISEQHVPRGSLILEHRIYAPKLSEELLCFRLKCTFRLARCSVDSGMRMLMQIVRVDIIDVAVTLSAVASERAF